MADPRGVYAAIERLNGTDPVASALELCKFVNVKDAVLYLLDVYSVTAKLTQMVELNWFAEVLDGVPPKKAGGLGIKEVEAGKVFARKGGTVTVRIGLSEQEFKSSLVKELKG